MKPSTPIDTEMVFLRDVEKRLAALKLTLQTGGKGVGVPAVLGLQSVLNNRLAEVTKQRDDYLAYAQQDGFECDGHNCPPRAHDHKVLI